MAGDLDRDLLRRIAIATIVGELGEGDWPPTRPEAKSWRRDERQHATIADHLGLVQSGWDKLVADALLIADHPRFELLEIGLTHLLEQGHVLAEAPPPKSEIHRQRGDRHGRPR